MSYLPMLIVLSVICLMVAIVLWFVGAHEHSVYLENSKHGLSSHSYWWLWYVAATVTTFGCLVFAYQAYRTYERIQRFVTRMTGVVDKNTRSLSRSPFRSRSPVRSRSPFRSRSPIRSRSKSSSLCASIVDTEGEVLPRIGCDEVDMYETECGDLIASRDHWNLMWTGKKIACDLSQFDLQIAERLGIADDPELALEWMEGIRTPSELRAWKADLEPDRSLSDREAVDRIVDVVEAVSNVVKKRGNSENIERTGRTGGMGRMGRMERMERWRTWKVRMMDSIKSKSRSRP